MMLVWSHAWEILHDVLEDVRLVCIFKDLTNDAIAVYLVNSHLANRLVMNHEYVAYTSLAKRSNKLDGALKIVYSPEQRQGVHCMEWFAECLYGASGAGPIEPRTRICMASV